MSIPQMFRDDPFLTPADIMEITGMKRSNVYNRIRRDMKFYRFGRRIFIQQSDFLKWIDNHTQGVY